jgi:ABC transport system ATP-binding/permease protein
VTDRRIASLSEVEKRKLSIAVELIGYPKLLLLDESAEPLTPFDEVQITILMRELSRQGITIILVNPRSRSAGLSDKIIFLAPGGYLAWFGPSDEAFAYLKGFLPRGVVKDLFGLQEAIEMLVNPQAQDGVEWAKRFKASAPYEKYVDDPLNNRYPDLLLQTRPLLRIRLRNSSKEKLAPPIIPRASALQKLALLISRDSRLLWRDKTALFMLAIPPLVALIHLALSSTAQLSSGAPPIVFNLRVFLVLLVAALLVQNEIVKERAVYQREQSSALFLPYILSKLWMVTILAIYQGLVWTAVHSFAEVSSGLAGGFQALLPSGVTFFLIAFIGGVFGLIASALSRRATTVTGWVLLLTIPQLLFLINPLSDWPKLAIMSLVLIGILVGIQYRATNVRT